MAESEAEQRIKTLNEIEVELLRAVQIAGAEFRAANARYAAALAEFSRFILEGLRGGCQFISPP